MTLGPSNLGRELSLEILRVWQSSLLRSSLIGMSHTVGARAKQLSHSAAAARFAVLPLRLRSKTCLR